MKRTKSMIYKESIESHELYLYAINTGEIFRREITPRVEALKKKAKKGTFDKDKATDLFYQVATSASKAYEKDFGYGFDVQARFTAAVDMVNRFTDEINRI